jgi:XTP/dITP diphosphohydrolase
VASSAPLSGNSLRLLIATTNLDKLREIREILGHLPVELTTLRDCQRIAEPEETGTTFEENARLKALYYDARLKPDAMTVAEDSGLVIDALDGAPGVHSARFLGPDASYAERFDEILARLSEAPGQDRTARFVSAIAVVRAGAVIYETTGTVEGEISHAASGSGGFGYDPIFFYPPYKRTLAEVTQAEKLAVAHRGLAFRQLAGWLAKGM